MSELRLNIVDASGAVNGAVHGSITDAVIAALSAEPETIAELEAALDRFIKRVDDRRPGRARADACATDTPAATDEPALALGLLPGRDFEPWDAGLIIVDLAARIVAAESSYSAPQPGGAVRYHDGTQATDVRLPFHVPDDWLFVSSVADYEARRDQRLRLRSGPALDAREVIYGAAMTEFIASECLQLGAGGIAACRVREERGSDGARNIVGEPRAPIGDALLNPQSSILDSQSSPSLSGFADLGDFARNAHARWLMTPREDLGGRSPREVILEKQGFIDFDLQDRAFQWSMLNEGPPPLSRDCFAYRYAGFGTHEYVVYYHLVRYLLTEILSGFAGLCDSARSSLTSQSPIRNSQFISPQSEMCDPSLALAARLEVIKQAWLNEPQDEFDGRIPSAIIESERRRIPIVMSAKETMIDENCDLCRLMADESADFGPAFWHLDASGLDDQFEFSTCRTREEWEAEQRKWREFSEEFERQWAAERLGSSDNSDEDQSHNEDSERQKL